MDLRKYSLSEHGFSLPSIFNSAHILSREELLSFDNETICNEIMDFEESYERKFDFYLYDSGHPSNYMNEFKFEGIVYEFNELKNKNDIETFAQKYGLLGIAHPKPLNYSPLEKYENLDAFYKSGEASRFGLDGLTVEPLDLWEEQIKHLQKLMNLFVYLKKHKNNFSKLANYEHFIINEWSGGYDVYWKDKTKAGWGYEKEKLNSPLTICNEILIKSILTRTQNLKSETKTFDSPKSPLGIHIVKIPYTNSLIEAIYYDFERNLNKDTDLDVCQNPLCNRTFKRIDKRTKWCSSSCKQDAYRARKKVEVNKK